MSSRDILLVRHAHAGNPAPGQDDAARALSATGIHEAKAAGAWLKQHGAAPDRVLCSPAVRAQSTCDLIVAALGSSPAQEDARIYEATPATLLRLVDESADARCLMLVGHNPGLEALVALLSEGASDSGRGMPPGAVAWLTLPPGDIEPGTAQIRHFWWP